MATAEGTVSADKVTDLALKIEPLTAAPFYMAFAPQMMLRYYRGRDFLKAKLSGVALPLHA